MTDSAMESVSPTHIHSGHTPTCPICQDIFSHPKVLACGHSFCLECLRAMAPRGTSHVKCPLCGRPSTIPNGDIYELPTNFGLQDAIEGFFASDVSPPERSSHEAREGR